MDILSQIRTYSYLSAVLSNREGDPYCRTCNSFLSTLMTVTEHMQKFEREHAAEIEKLPDGFSLFFLVAKSRINGIRLPERPVSQKKAGNCNLPESVCYLKSSFAVLQRSHPAPDRSLFKMPSVRTNGCAEGVREGEG